MINKVIERLDELKDDLIIDCKDLIHDLVEQTFNKDFKDWDLFKIKTSLKSNCESIIEQIKEYQTIKYYCNDK